MARREEKASAPGRPPKRQRRNTAVYVFIAVIAVVVVGGLVAIAILAGTQPSGTPIGDVLAKSDWGDELVEVAGTVQEVRAAGAGNMVWYKLADSSGAIWVNAAVEGESSLREVGLISGGRIWLPLAGPKPEVGDARRVQALVVSSAPPEGAPADASPYLFPAKPYEER